MRDLLPDQVLREVERLLDLRAPASTSTPLPIVSIAPSANTFHSMPA
jgi:hypothetical protein